MDHLKYFIIFLVPFSEMHPSSLNLVVFFFWQHLIVQEQLLDLSVDAPDTKYSINIFKYLSTNLTDADHTIVLENFINIQTSPQQSTQEVFKSRESSSFYPCSPHLPQGPVHT